MSNPETNANIARHLGYMASARPNDVAIKVPKGRRGGRIDYLALSFAELEAEVIAWQSRLSEGGIRAGDRTLVMVRQGLPLIASVFALFRHGAIPIVVDPGMGLKHFLLCVERSAPKALVGITFARVLSRIFPHPFRTVEFRVGASSRLTARLTQRGPLTDPTRILPLAIKKSTDLAAVLFTSGSTGAPKGVAYEHGMFEAQVRSIQATYDIKPGEVDLPLLPIFALFNPALGMTTIVPELDPKRPAEVDPAKIVQAIQQENVTNSFGSPTLWNKIGTHCVSHGITLPSLRRVLCAGAPVPAELWEKSRAFLPNGRLHSPYGATEALPVATVSADEIDPSSVGGACVGRPVNDVMVRIIVPTDRPLINMSETSDVPPGDIGEIIVHGPVVTKTYDAQPAATTAAKISEGHAKGRRLWHRMGDCGFIDGAGRIWFCGRKAERVETVRGPMYTEPVEQVFRRHPRARRCALIGLGNSPHQHPALVVETRVSDSKDARTLARELRAFAVQHPHTEAIKTFYFHPRFPVDVRHNAKIHRLVLGRWAVTAKGFHVDPKK